MPSSQKLIALFASIVLFSVPALGIDGPEPPEPGTQEYNDNIALYEVVEAVCGWGQTLLMSGPDYAVDCNGGCNLQANNTVCGGVLIAPNVVLTASHCLNGGFDENSEGVLIGPSDPRLQAKKADGTVLLNADGVPVPKYSVRFRLNEDGVSVGTQAGGYESFFEAPIKYMMLAPGFDALLLILSDGPNDTDDFGIWNKGWITHIAPQRMFTDFYPNPVPLNLHGCSYGPTLANGPDRGALRIFDFGFERFNQSGTRCVDANGLGTDNGDKIHVGDSGGVFIMQTESGEYIVCFGIDGGTQEMQCFPESATWRLFLDQAVAVGNAEVDLLHPKSSFDIVDSLLYQSYGAPEYEIDVGDVLSVASTNPAISANDWDGDGDFDRVDFVAYSNDVVAALNPYFADSLFPLKPGASDINGDRRLSLSDYELLDDLIVAGGAINPAFVSLVMGLSMGVTCWSWVMFWRSGSHQVDPVFMTTASSAMPMVTAPLTV